MKSFTFIVIAIGIVCASAHNGVNTTLVTCSEVLTISDCTQLNPKNLLYTSYECGWDQDIDGCNTENCCGVPGTGGCVSDWIADGYCDSGNNNADCGNYDGGDCCECTCMDAEFTCGNFDCRDPIYPCGDDGGEIAIL